MTVTLDIPAEPKRDRFGRYLIDGKPYTRATTIAGTLEDTYNLSRWQMRMAVHGITLRDDLLAQAQAHNPDDDKTTYNQLCSQALDAASSSRGANLGTALHRFTQDLDTGRKTLDDIPEPHQTICRRYATILDTHGVTIDQQHVEQVVINTTRQIAGTIDRVATLPDGRRVICDLKTGATLDWSWLKILVQLAIYADHTNTYNYATETSGPPLNIDLNTALVVHLPSNGDGAALYTVDLNAGMDLMLLSLEVREWRKDAKKKVAVYNPVTTPYTGATALRDWIADRIRTISDTGPAAVTDLRNRWPETVPTPLPEQPTSEQIDELAQVLTRVEALHEIPFGHSRPGATQPTKQPNKKAS